MKRGKIKTGGEKRELRRKESMNSLEVRKKSLYYIYSCRMDIHSQIEMTFFFFVKVIAALLSYS